MEDDAIAGQRAEGFGDASGLGKGCEAPNWPQRLSLFLYLLNVNWIFAKNDGTMEPVGRGLEDNISQAHGQSAVANAKRDGRRLPIVSQTTSPGWSGDLADIADG